MKPKDSHSRFLRVIYNLRMFFMRHVCRHEYGKICEACGQPSAKIIGCFGDLICMECGGRLL